MYYQSKNKDAMSSELLTPFLKVLYDWRNDLREMFDISNEDGQLKFILWWIRWGCKNYPSTSIMYGISIKFLQEHVYFTSNISDISYPPLSKVFIYEINQNIDVNSVEYINWLFEWGYSILMTERNEFNDIVLERALIFISTKESLIESRIKDNFLGKMEEIFEESFEKIIRERKAIVTIFGKEGLNIGIGVDARLIYKSLVHVGIKCKYYNSDSKYQYTPFNIFTLPAPDAFIQLTQMDIKLLSNSINILSAPWELPIWPSSLEFLFDFFDQIWVHSEYVFSSIPKKYHFKVKKIHLPVEVDYDLKQFATPNKNKDSVFKVLSSFDLASFVQRKNPYGNIDTFLRAFNTNPKYELILKINGAELRPKELSELLDYIKNFRNITIIAEVLPWSELHLLYSNCNCFLSLHRSEGFGRNIAEMMLLKKPVIVTGFSGNMDFTNTDNSWVIPFDKKYLKSDDYIFSESQYWAEPDIEKAAECLIEISKGYDKAKIERAFEMINNNYNLITCGLEMKYLLERL